MHSLRDGPSRTIAGSHLVAILLACVSYLAMAPTAALAADDVYRDGGFEFRVGPAPAWVKEAPAQAPVDTGRPVPGGVAIAIVDFQYRYDPTPTTYDRRVIVPVDASGLQSVAHIQVEFNPAFAKLTLHEIAIVRDGKRTSRLAPERVRLIQRERDLEKRMYDGTVTATLVIEDVRIGDAVDYSYSVEGTNPLWPPKLATMASAGGFAPIVYARSRLIANAGRPVRVLPRATDAKAMRTEQGGQQEWTWEQRDVPVVDPSESVAPSFPVVPLLQFSEIADWNVVVAWGMPLFEVPTDLSPELQKRVTDWMAANADPKIRTAAALRYVQGEIRYFGVELGTGALKPRHPNETARTGFGDCKDKSILLIALLRRMGIEAVPTLASLRFGFQLDQMLPSAKLFDHMLTEASFGNEKYFLDATQTWQGGDLNAMAVRTYGFVLPIAAGRGALVKLNRAGGPPNIVDRREDFLVVAWDKPASLRIETTYFGLAANIMRAITAQVRNEQMNRSLLETIQRRFKGATPEGLVEVADDRAANEVKIRQRYQVPEYTDRANGTPTMYVLGSGLLDAFVRPKQETRRAPYELEYPLEYRHRTVVDLPEPVKPRAPESHRVRDAYFTFDSRIEVADRRLVYEASWKSETDVVPVADWPAFRAKIDEARRFLVYAFVPQPVAPQTMLDKVFGTKKYVHDHHEKREAIEKATKAILSGRLSGDSLAEAYRDRGINYSNMNLLDEARFDLDKSLALRPNDISTITDRALVATSAGRYDDAERDYDRALALDPLLGRNYQLRGVNRYHARKFGLANADFRRSLELGGARQGNYPLVWLFVTTLREGGDPKVAVQSYPANADPGAWPYPVLAYYQGAAKLDALLAAAKDRDEATTLFQLCEVYYFIGAYALAQGDTATAREYFEKALATDVREFMEWQAASIELARMKK